MANCKSTRNEGVCAVNKLQQYISGKSPLPEKYMILPVYGAGLDNVGDEEGGTIEKVMDQIADDELLVRHDADSICFSDIKVIKQGQDHPRIYQNMSEDPVVLGHELTMTIVKVGEKLKGKYKIGQRFTIQADIYEKGVSYAYGYYFQGGMSQYGVIKPIVLSSDGGNNNLLPLKDSTGYAEGALAEPWACVVAAYSLRYRRTLKAGGKAWFIGVDDERIFELTTGFDIESHPGTVYVTGLNESMNALIVKKAQEYGTNVVTVDTIDDLPVEFVDDIIMLGVDIEKVECCSTKLDKFGIFCVMADKNLDKKVPLDLGRVHYHRWLYIGSTGTDISATYQNSLPRNTLLSGGTALYAGAGGPIGRMHVQRAIEFQNPPRKIVCTDVSEMRLQDMRDTYSAQAAERGIELVLLNPMEKASYLAAIQEVMNEGGFSDVIVLAPIAPLIEEISGYLAEDGLMNIFAGIARGTMVKVDFEQVYRKNIRYIGHSGSRLDDMQLTLDKIESGELNATRTVAAVGSLHYGRDGLKAVNDAKYPGKVVIFNHIKKFPVTSLPEFKEKLPTVFALFEHGEWTNAAEKEFLRLMLVD